ncbi:hypothetical protein DERP_000517 [Dermatophagoides pteronyssinus]|uniref:Uncharacterized protein n=1 Tax=Dermatophagoides pteronyssinus TaxID=6956 RepID=A0ABQ8J0P9_DERPT|nr:hypothetical protein DERP_000517 [Dermatophagoides pteronyssinus]
MTNETWIATIPVNSNGHSFEFRDDVDIGANVPSKFVLTFVVPEFVVDVAVTVDEGECLLRKLFFNTAITEVSLTFEFESLLLLFALELSRLFRPPSVFECGLNESINEFFLFWLLMLLRDKRLDFDEDKIPVAINAALLLSWNADLGALDDVSCVIIFPTKSCALDFVVVVVVVDSFAPVDETDFQEDDDVDEDVPIDVVGIAVLLMTNSKAAFLNSGR